MEMKPQEAEQLARETVDRIVGKMCEIGFPVEMKHKAGHKANYLPVSNFGGWESQFEHNLAWVLIGAWESKHALIHLLEIAREDARTTPNPPQR